MDDLDIICYCLGNSPYMWHPMNIDLWNKQNDAFPTYKMVFVRLIQMCEEFLLKFVRKLISLKFDHGKSAGTLEWQSVTGGTSWMVESL